MKLHFDHGVSFAMAYGITVLPCTRQVNIPRLNLSYRPVLDLPTPKGQKAELAW